MNEMQRLRDLQPQIRAIATIAAMPGANVVKCAELLTDMANDAEALIAKLESRPIFGWVCCRQGLDPFFVSREEDVPSGPNVAVTPVYAAEDSNDD